jgi:ribonuclease HI
VRGHAGDPKNEYADYLAVRAATEQRTSEGAVPSTFDTWLAEKRDQGHFPDYDPDAEFAALSEL